MTSEQTKTILLVDDEASVLQLVKGIFEEEGYSVTTATSGKEAFERLEEFKPDLLVLDIMMPGLSGLEVCEKLRKNPKWKDLKVIVLTVVGKTDDVELRLSQLDVLDFIEKPFRIQDLLQRVKEAMS